MADQIQAGSFGGALAKARRLAYIDWMRGLACVLMFQAHCYSAWLNPDARKSEFYRWSQAVATLPAPLCIFLAGISSAMVTQRLREKGIARNAIARTTILRGAEIFGLGLLFRGQEYLLGYPKSPWTDLLRVDVLNILGVSMMLLGVLCWLTAARAGVVGASFSASESRASKLTVTIIAALTAAAVVAVVTPWLWTTYRPRWLPWPLESYINGVHIYAQPQPWLFPIFPWVAFAFVGLALGFLLFSDFAKKREAWLFAAVGAAGVIACGLPPVLGGAPPPLYSAAIFHYRHPRPGFLLVRCRNFLAPLSFNSAGGPWGLAPERVRP